MTDISAAATPSPKPEEKRKSPPDLLPPEFLLSVSAIPADSPAAPKSLAQQFMEMMIQSSSDHKPKPETKLPPAVKWIYFGLPFRAAFGTYRQFDWVPDLPPEETKLFSHLISLVDVEIEKEWLDHILQSPTSCHVQVDFVSGVFYRDQQDCVLWAFDPLDVGGVYVYEPPNTPSGGASSDEDDFDDHQPPPMTVATTLAEFFGRIHLENRLWHKIASCSHPDAFASHSSLGKTPLTDPHGLWTAFSASLAESELTYAKALFNRWCISTAIPPPS